MSNGAPLVSIGLPVYNGDRFLAETIDCLLGQRDVRLELVISDNGSTDDTEKICRLAAEHDDRVRYVRVEQNRGAAWNFNRVVELARGSYFTWAAHDDLYTPNSLSRCVAVLEADPGVSLAFGRAVDIDGDGKVLYEYPPLAYADGSGAATRGRDVLRTPSPCFEVFGVVRRTQLLKTGMIGAYTSSDRALLYELALNGRFHELPDVLFHHRQHEDRSVFTHRDPRDRDAWFDPDRATVMTLPRWRLVIEHVRAVMRTPLPPPERALALGHVAAWAARKASPLARDLAAWGRHHLSPGRRIGA